ncbi:MAG TPA: Ig-like domain-containing protein [Longimicrobium sp.]|nr:Ig-like domain-containing protein [Longimicrobium sp.]
MTVASGAMRCAGVGPELGGARGLIVGNQGEYVFLEATNHTFTGGDNVFSIDVTVQNLLPQALGTTDGTTLDPAAVRVFFYLEPEASDGSGRSVSVINHTGTAFFTTAGQKYFQYDEVLSTNETSAALPWEFSVDPLLESFHFQLFVAAAVQFPDGYVDVTPPADTVTQGGTVALSHVVRTAVGEPSGDQSVTWGTSDGAVATVDASGVVTAVAPGTATITATQGAISGTAAIAVCPSLAVGGAYVVANLNSAPSLCLSTGEYTLGAVNTAEVDTIPLAVTGTGIVPATEPPSPLRRPGGASFARSGGMDPDYGFEARLRRLERRQVAGRIATGGGPRRGPGAPRFAITPGVPAVGALMSLNVETDNSCSTFDTRTGRVVAVGTHVIVMEDTLNPEGGLTAAQYAAIADSFDLKIHPTITGAFGTPSDRDGNGRVIAFYTSAVNELTGPGSSAYVGGFFFSRDLLAATDCPTSNVGEMFYMLAADTSGTVNGNKRSADFIEEVTLGTLAHEFQHLINASRRMLVNTPWNGQLEETWLDEGLAHVAEELMFYQGSGTAPGMDLDLADLSPPAVQDPFFKYAEANYGRLRQWLLAPHGNGPFEAGDDGLATRGSAWAFLRYAADRRGGTQATFWSSLVNTGNTGLENLEAVLGTDPLPWFRDFAGAMYADNAFDPVSPPASFTQPSWNFRAVFSGLDYDPGPACSCNYPLAPRDPGNGVTDSFVLIPGGGTAYLRMGVSAGAFAGVAVQSGGVAPPSTIRLVVIRRK